METGASYLARGFMIVFFNGGGGREMRGTCGTREKEEKCTKSFRRERRRKDTVWKTSA